MGSRHNGGFQSWKSRANVPYGQTSRGNHNFKISAWSTFVEFLVTYHRRCRRRNVLSPTSRCYNTAIYPSMLITQIFVKGGFVNFQGTRIDHVRDEIGEDEDNQFIGI